MDLAFSAFLLGDFDRLLVELGHLLAQRTHALVHLADFALLGAGGQGEQAARDGELQVTSCHGQDSVYRGCLMVANPASSPIDPLSQKLFLCSPVTSR
ncbi:hypothetical protein [Klebsiella pneumoniae IS43]|uniref:Uncharacterized protein n=1 Tax=Klebsiella pneumoniae IS43 TaxID=1432552 RepID=W1DKM9_KLEPN|nr:hypothetical protein [Klebsiella pneumoniae IS43]